LCIALFRMPKPIQILETLQTLRSRPDLVLAILPEFADPIRQAVKIWGDCEVGIPTQCVVCDVLRVYAILALIFTPA
jgi:hypothetical protein